MDEHAFVLERQHFRHLLAALQERGYQTIGPTVREGAIVYDVIESDTDLPVGWGDIQDEGSYQLMQRAEAALFGYTLSPQSWKRFLHPPDVRLWQAHRTDGTFSITPAADEIPRCAFIGVRACELHAIAILDRVFLDGAFVDPIYQRRRAHTFIVAVNCGQASGTCFCASMQTGPAVDSGFDLALTEVIDAERHYFVVNVGTEGGAEVLNALPHREASAEEIAAAAQIVAATAEQMGRSLETANLKATLYNRSEDPLWDEVAERCLTCGNCTLVCPTCFCTTVTDVTDLSGAVAERRRQWDSCFTMEFSYIHGGSVRYTPKARYRQWMTHKLASWIDQFGVSGCVGCGRCITWCPVGIDITDMARRLQTADQPLGEAR
ncbi:MAG: sulfite reductase subunit A [Chloroflexi bacterium]|nr:sulfite reductase subunit A [Chloroflexota bacterium]